MLNQRCLVLAFDKRHTGSSHVSEVPFIVSRGVFHGHSGVFGQHERLLGCRHQKSWLASACLTLSLPNFELICSRDLVSSKVENHGVL